MVYEWLNSVQQTVYPPTCLLCGNRGWQNMDICCGCHDDLPLNASHCHSCAAPLPADAHLTLCGTCQARPPPFARVWAPFLYKPPIDHLVQAFKFRRQLACGRLLAMLVQEQLSRWPVRPPELLVPVPLHPDRLRERGFNQAWEIVRYLGKTRRIPVESSLCRRVRATPPQSRLDAAHRKGNLAGAFRVPAQSCAGHIAVVDDVITSGQTVREVASTIRRGGAASVDVWACARA